MKNFISVIVALLLPFSALALKKKKSEHREHEAHVHGAASLAIAFDGLKGRIEFKSASEAVMGFEYQPKSTKDKKIFEETVGKFDLMDKLVQFDSSLDCVFKKEKIEMIPDGEHSDFVANFDVTCGKSVLGSSVIIDFTRFSRLKDLDITVLAGSLQKSVEAKGKPVTIQLR